MRILWIHPGHSHEQWGDAVQTLEFASNGTDGLNMLKNSSFDVLLASFPLSDWEPEELLEEAQRIDASLPVIVQDPGATLASAVRLTKLGAFHCLGESVDSEELQVLIEDAAAHRPGRQQSASGSASGGEAWRRFLVGDSQAMQNVVRVVRLIGARRCTVLITGETGTGKEMAARAIHMAGNRSHLPMVAVNCSALPENLLEAELFGHVRGAFTGAVNHRVGRFEQAHRGTLFLDEIGDMPLDLQAKLLRVLQEREIQRLGSSETIHVDVRVIAASNVDLTERIRQGKFREDLYYRLNVVPLAMPPLRDHLRDVPALVHHFIEKICRQEDLPPRHVAPETLARLVRYSWPGNVRQLENAIEKAIALSGDRLTLYPGDFALPSLAESKPATSNSSPVIAVPDVGLDFERTVGEIERAILEQALRKTNGNKKQAADMLGLKRTTLSAKLKSLEAVACVA